MCYRGETQVWDLQSLLIKPVQRVLKYPLLLDKLVETTSTSHPDHTPLRKAKESITNVAQDINEVKRGKDIGEGGRGRTEVREGEGGEGGGREREDREDRGEGGRGRTYR